MGLTRIAAAVVLALLAVTVADASPITVPTDTPLILNFDFTGETPPPPYDSLALSFGFDTYSGQNLSVNIYPDLDGGGTLFNGFTLSGCCGSTIFLNITLFNDPSNVPILDGIFSVSFLAQDLGGLVPNPRLISASAMGTATGGGSVTLDPTSLTPVPEPASLLLLGSGLAGVVARARRVRKTPTTILP